MPQPHSRIIVHLIFSTKDRVPFLTPRLRGELFQYLPTVAQENECDCREVGGSVDHVHLAVLLPATKAPAELVERLKSESCRWLKSRMPVLRSFDWQRGYAAFSVSPAKLPTLITYIANQEEYHRTHTFQDEYRGFLKKASIAFDEGTVWE